MSDPLERERPSKRIKTEPQQPCAADYQQPFFVSPSSITMTTAGDPWAAVSATFPPDYVPPPAQAPGTSFEAPWAPLRMLIPFDQTLGSRRGSDSGGGGSGSGSGGSAWPLIPGPGLTPAPFPFPALSPSVTVTDPMSLPTSAVIEAIPAPPVPAALHLELGVLPPTFASHQSSRSDGFPQFGPSPSAADAAAMILNSSPQTQDLRCYKHRSRTAFISPFKDCLGSFGNLPSPRFPRPSDGKVNGYIKFNWPTRKAPLPRSSSFTAVVTECDGDSDGDDNSNSNNNDNSDDGGGDTPQSSSQCLSTTSQSSKTLTFDRCSPTPSASTVSVMRFPAESHARSSISFPSLSPSSQYSSSFAFPFISHDPSLFDRSSGNSPRLVPPQFGLQAKMDDDMDRRFWEFYIQNWCPGRSVLDKTNLWLQDFAKMHGSAGVRAAIQSLAGIYIYDYQPMDTIRRRTNVRFANAEERLSTLLRRPDDLSEDEASELITIASILSMQDIVLTERRLKKPQNPRWLVGYRQSEHFLESIDRGSRFWRKSNVQLSSLRISQSIIVGRAVILAQPMMPLPSPAGFDPEQEASRFGWLLYGTAQDMYEIHGGCGFSKKLLHVMSQITYCAARLQQDRESPIAPLTMKYVLEELKNMRQWNSESGEWDAAKGRPQTIERVWAEPSGYVINSSADMTDVTAEAWRIAAMIYLQCRALRLPRNHEDVIANMTDLAKCISIMPTSGSHFTAQAPLFPVFLLGLLAVQEDHMRVSRTWFDMVVTTPVRSSVPPLYLVLQRAWSWINADPMLTPPVNCPLPEAIGDRSPWWEYLVARIQSKEEEVLCLT